MSVKIRLSRGGKKGAPFYTIVAIDHRKHRDSGAILEKLGTYNPSTKDITLKKEGVEKWLNVGAIPSETVGKILKKEGVAFKEKVRGKKEPKKESA